MSFSDLGLSAEVQRAVADAGYATPTPIQEQAIPVVLTGRDVLGCAQTGTGKTAGFTLPMIDVLAAGRARARMPRSLILEPTRELAAQVAENFAIYGKYNKLTMALLIGGVAYADQEKALDRGVDVLIATPGRLLDHFERGRILLNDVKILVIDEADRMLDMGFIPDVEKIVGLLPPLRQTLFFSATMPPEIRRLADAFLRNPKEISVSPPTSPAATVTQGLAIVEADDRIKREALRRLLGGEEVRNALIFCNRKRDVDTLARSLKRHGFNAAALHGDMDQGSRTLTLEAFKLGEIQMLVASDVAARGLDIDDLSHVFNFDVPLHPEDYIHRIGRTGRAGRSGRAFTIATTEDGRYVTGIEALIGKSIPRIAVEDMAPLELSAEGGRRGRRGPAARDRRPAAPSRRRGSEPAARGHEPVAQAEPPVPVRPAAPPPPVHNERPAAVARPERADRHERHERRPREEHREHREHREERPRQNAPIRQGEPFPRAARPAEDDRPFIGMGDHVPAFLMRGRKTGT